MNKGLQPSTHGSDMLLKAIKETGYKRLTLKSDQEPTIRALCNHVQGKFAGEIIPEAAPKEYHERSNGEAEATVKQVHGLVRTLTEFLMLKMGNKEIPPKHPGLAWMVEHAGTLQTLYGRGEDGLTPWHRLKGKPWRAPLPCFGEVVEFKLRTRHKLEARWRPGVFLGARRITTEKSSVISLGHMSFSRSVESMKAEGGTRSCSSQYPEPLGILAEPVTKAAQNESSRKPSR